MIQPGVMQQVQLECKEPREHALSVSVIVPTRDRNVDLDHCLEAISRLSPAPMEIIVVDSAPQREGAREVALRWRASYFREDLPGASRARNRGAREACGDIVAYTDDDAVPDRNWLDSILDEFTDGRVALVAGKAEPPHPEPGLNPLYELCGFSGQGNDRIAVERDTPEWFQTVNFLPFGLGPNLAVRRSVFQQWGGFDERLGPGTPVPGHEEQHVFLQLIDLGFRLVYAPTARVTHPVVHQGYAEELLLRGLRRMQASSAYLTLLMVEKPRYRREVLGYILRKVFSSGKMHTGANEIQISRIRCLLARLQGPGLYFKSRLEHYIRATGKHIKC